eukprot:scaffold5454_cov176-Amphora_coffeaeformis.AAC.6
MPPNLVQDLDLLRTCSLSMTVVWYTLFLLLVSQRTDAFGTASFTILSGYSQNADPETGLIRCAILGCGMMVSKNEKQRHEMSLLGWVVAI